MAYLVENREYEALLARRGLAEKAAKEYQSQVEDIDEIIELRARVCYLENQLKALSKSAVVSVEVKEND